MIAKSKKFTGIKVVLDGSTFDGCTFKNCDIVYGGLLPVSMANCTFDSCSYSFHGNARDTLNFMKALYGAGAGQIIENTFDSIRGKPPGGATLH